MVDYAVCKLKADRHRTSIDGLSTIDSCLVASGLTGVLGSLCG